MEVAPKDSVARSTVMVAGAGVPKALNVTGLPVAPSRLALSVLTPDPSTQPETVATPEALLTALPPDTTPNPSRPHASAPKTGNS